MEIIVQNLQDLVPIHTHSVKDALLKVLDVHPVTFDDLMVYFVDESTICQLHDKHFNDPSPTDCISIQVDAPNTSDCFLGEIYVSPQAALDHCKTTEANLYEELTLYVIHGFLHLIGYDDLENESREKMRLAEKKLMDYLKSCHKIITK